MSKQTHIWRPKQVVRPISIGIIWRADCLLLDAMCSDDGSIKGWRPLGGEIEFGERAIDALHREFVEEIGEPVSEQRLIGVLENHYEHYRVKGHEIVFVFEVKFVNPETYEREIFRYKDNGISVRSEWVALKKFQEKDAILFPNGLIEMLNVC